MVILVPVLVPMMLRLGIRMGIRIASELYQNGVLQLIFASERDRNGHLRGLRNDRPISTDARDAFRGNFAGFASEAGIRLVLMPVQRRRRIAGSTAAIPGTPPLGRKAALFPVRSGRRDGARREAPLLPRGKQLNSQSFLHFRHFPAAPGGRRAGWIPRNGVLLQRFAGFRGAPRTPGRGRQAGHASWRWFSPFWWIHQNGKWLQRIHTNFL